MKTVKVEMETRAIRATWTAELARDVASFTSFDPVKELEILLRGNTRNSKISKILKSLKHSNSF